MGVQFLDKDGNLIKTTKDADGVYHQTRIYKNHHGVIIDDTVDLDNQPPSMRTLPGTRTVNDIRYQAFKEAEEALKQQMKMDRIRAEELHRILEQQAAENKKKRNRMISIAVSTITAMICSFVTATIVQISKGAIIVPSDTLENAIKIILLSPFVAILIWLIHLIFKDSKKDNDEETEKKYHEYQSGLVQTKPIGFFKRKMIAFHLWRIEKVVYRHYYKILCIAKPDLPEDKVEWFKEDENCK